MQAIPRLKLLFERPLGKPLATERCALTRIATAWARVLFGNKNLAAGQMKVTM